MLKIPDLKSLGPNVSDFGNLECSYRYHILNTVAHPTGSEPQGQIYLYFINSKVFKKRNM